jgi:hypothetical protein
MWPWFRIVLLGRRSAPCDLIVDQLHTVFHVQFTSIRYQLRNVFDSLPVHIQLIELIFKHVSSRGAEVRCHTLCWRAVDGGARSFAPLPPMLWYVNIGKGKTSQS